jgi:hypothetical protein
MDRAEQLEEAARLIWHSRAVSCYALSGHEHHASTNRNGARDGAALRAYQNLTSRDAAVTKGFSRPSLVPYLRKRNRPSHGGIRGL